MRAKPEFNWKGHKLLWDKLAKDGSLSKGGALYELIREGLIPSDSASMVHQCFACEAVWYINSMYCTKKTCPLDWGKDADTKWPCVSDGVGLYDEWEVEHKLGDMHKAQETAAQIRDLPLSENARKLYTIIE